MKFKDNSIFEKTADISLLQTVLNDTLKLRIGGDLANVTVRDRGVRYKDFLAVLLDLDPSIKTGGELNDILPRRVRQYWKNELISWYIDRLESNDYKSIGVNLADFVIKLVPHYEIDRSKFIIRSTDIAVRNNNLTKDQIKSYCNLLKKIHSVNDSFEMYYPQWLRPDKFDLLLDTLIPPRSIITTDRNYSQVLLAKMNSNASNPTRSAQTIFRFNGIYPGLIIGGGPSNIPAPSFTIAGDRYNFLEYEHDPVQTFVEKEVARCGNCKRPGYDRPQCKFCNNLLQQKRDEITAKQRHNKTDPSIIRKMVGNTKADFVCHRCSKLGHKYSDCYGSKPYCYLCGCSHTVGDFR